LLLKVGFVFMVSHDRKSRAWGFIYYPDSPDDLSVFDEVSSVHVPCLLSPLHDSDVWTSVDAAKNPEHVAGSLKKAHYHGMWLFDGPARVTQALDLCKAFGSHCPPHVEPIASVTSMTRYFIHLDNPGKFQYNSEDISALNGAVVNLQKPLTPEEITEAQKAALAWCREVHCVEYADLVDYCLDVRPDWFQVVSTRTIFFAHYLQSLRLMRGGGEIVKKDKA
jgi:hypothetical protein